MYSFRCESSLCTLTIVYGRLCIRFLRIPFLWLYWRTRILVAAAGFGCFGCLEGSGFSTPFFLKGSIVSWVCMAPTSPVNLNGKIWHFPFTEVQRICGGKNIEHWEGTEMAKQSQSQSLKFKNDSEKCLVFSFHIIAKNLDVFIKQFPWHACR
jgi:hypothetical protein